MMCVWWWCNHEGLGFLFGGYGERELKGALRATHNAGGLFFFPCSFPPKRDVFCPDEVEIMGFLSPSIVGLTKLSLQ